MPNFMRLALGTLTRIPVTPPDSVNRIVAAYAMSIAPVIGLLLALLVGIPMLALALVAGAADNLLTSLLIAALAIAFLAWLSRALHLDGLADTADALGSGRPANEALEIARKSDIGPFGVVVIVFTMLLQVIALAIAFNAGQGFLALVIACLGSRVAITAACTRGVPAARPDGLGALVASCVKPLVTVIWVVVAVLVAGGLGIVETGRALAPTIAMIAGLLTALVVVVLARRRLGGITGDVLGAVVELSMVAILVVFALTLSR